MVGLQGLAQRRQGGPLRAQAIFHGPGLFGHADARGFQAGYVTR